MAVNPNWQTSWARQRTKRATRGYLTSMLGQAEARQRAELGLPAAGRVWGAAAALWRPRTCQYPHGEVGAADFHFCGAPVRDGSSYCAAHHTLCHEAQPRRSAEGLADIV
ncbi:MAG: hypothetical protein Kow00114_27190 [Kiloniellaceae bacterium]